MQTIDELDGVTTMGEFQVDKEKTNPPRILAVDDEPNIVEFLRVGLGYEGYQVESVMDGRAALDRIRQEKFDLIILDVMLPGLDGFEIVKRVRTNSQVPILMLTARDEVADRVTGLDLGADDYLVKPFSFAELVARVRAILRRQGIVTATAVLQTADIVLDRESHMVERAGEAIVLTAKEFELLEFFMSHPRQVFRRDVILDRVWGYDFAGDTNLVDVHIGHLRDKLNDRPPKLLRTVHGVGYVWRED
jgi:two-component system response regulator MprA